MEALQLAPAWRDKCLTGIPAADQQPYLLAQFLFAEIGCSSEAVLPPRIRDQQRGLLAGPCVLQMEQALNISQNEEARRTDPDAADSGPWRTLKLLLTDGYQTVVGMELRRVPSLNSRTPPGTKLVLRGVPVSHGVLLLTPANTVVLGGGLKGPSQAADAHTVPVPTPVPSS